MSWTDERVTLLRKMWGEGKSAAEIAKILGGDLTRNAVIGKAHRLKLSNRISPIQQTNKKPVETPVKAVAIKKIDIPAAPKKTGGGIAMVNLRERMCRWPEGDPKEPGFSFCGDDCVPGLPYCDYHAKQAYQTPSRSRVLAAEDFERETGNRYDLDEELKEAASG